MTKAPKQMMIYLDQSVLSAAVQKRFPLPSIDRVRWVYSDEHFKEIRRSNEPSKYLNLLQKIKADRAEIAVSQNLEFSDECKFFQNSNPHSAYKAYSDNLSNPEVDDDIFNPIILQFSGAANSAVALSALNNLENEVDRLSGGTLAIDVKDQAVIADELKHDFTIIDLRRALGTEHLHLDSSLSENVIKKIWSSISGRFPGVSIDQFFGFSSPFESGKSFAPFMGILRCYMMLNLLGYWPDKEVRKTSGLASSLSDGIHVAYSAYCHGFYSRDERAIRKARAIYEYMGLDRERAVLLAID